MDERFDMAKKDKINSWSIDDSLTKYALSQMNCFIPDSDIIEQILQEMLQEMDLNIKSLPLEKKTNETLSLDKDFCLMQEKTGNIFGPLSQIWDFLEGQKNAAHEQIAQIEGYIPEHVTEMFATAKDCFLIMDMSITMIEQIFNLSSYCRCRNVLLPIIGDKKKVKDMMSR